MIDFKKYINEIEPFVSIDGVTIDIEAIEPGTITLEQYHKTRTNSPGIKLLYTKLNNEALIHAVNHNLNNCTHHFDPAVYEYALQNYLVPELIKRLEENEEEEARKVVISDYNVAFCPRCNGSVWQNKDESSYCFRCGQKISWN